MASNWLRKYRLNAGPAGGLGFEIGDTDPHALHVSFSIEKSSSESSNTAKVQIWNLSPPSLAVLDGKDCKLNLFAGYSNANIALVLSGDIVTAETNLDNADRMTEIEVVDGRIALRETYLSLSYSGKVSSKTVLDDIAAQMGCAVVYSQKAQFTMLPQGFSFVGPAKSALQKLCGTCGLSWSLQNGVLQVHMPNEPITAQAYLLSADTGLLEVPKRITISAESDDDTASGSGTTSQIGYEVRYFLNGAIGVNDLIRLESKEARGYFRIYKLTIDGDNMEGEWTCTAQILEVK